MINKDLLKDIRPEAKTENMIIQELKDELLIYNLQTHQTFCLNKTSAMIWQNCDGKKTVHEISLLVSLKLNIAVNEDLVLLALNKLQKEKLLIDSKKSNELLKGVSRRELIHQTALASLTVLPLVYTVLSPTAAQAGSGSCSNPAFDSCVTDADCLTSPTGDTCDENCCITGGFIMGCINTPTNSCPSTPPGCDPIFGC